MRFTCALTFNCPLCCAYKYPRACVEGSHGLCSGYVVNKESALRGHEAYYACTSASNQSGNAIRVVSRANTKNTSPDMTRYSYISADSMKAVTKHT
jgi:hypothetical protein